MNTDTTFARRIDALGGRSDDHSHAWNEGYSQALTDAEKIAEEADALIAELLAALEAAASAADAVSDAARLAISHATEVTA